MAGYLKLYRSLIGAGFLGDMSYRRTVLLQFMGTTLNAGMEIVALFFLLDRFPDIAGWSLWEILYLFGIASFSLGISELICSGLTDLPELIRKGEFDHVLVRPLSPFFQIFARRLKLFQLGRIGQATLAITFALVNMDISWNLFCSAMLAMSIISNAAIYISLFVTSAASTFWTIQSSEAFNAFTYGGSQMSGFPVSVYPRWIQYIFFFIVPVGLATYFPALEALGKKDVLELPGYLAYLSPVAGLLCLIVASIVWRRGVNHYQSTGS